MSTVSVELSKLAPKLSGNLKVNRKKQSVNNLVAILHGTVRMSEWEYLDRDNAFKFESDKNKKLSIWVTPELVEVRKGLRKFPIGNGKDATTLFGNLKHVKAVIAKAQAEQLTGEASMSAVLSEALDDITSGNDAVTADDLNEDIHIPNAPALVDPIEVSLESEEIAGALENEMEREDDPFSRISNKLASAKQQIGIKLHDTGVSKEGCKQIADSIAGHLRKRGDLSGPVIVALKSLQGRILGIVDASFSDKEQRAAVKTLINKEFRREMDKFGGTNGVVSDEN